MTDYAREATEKIANSPRAIELAPGRVTINQGAITDIIQAAIDNATRELRDNYELNRAALDAAERRQRRHT